MEKSRSAVLENILKLSKQNNMFLSRSVLQTEITSHPIILCRGKFSIFICRNFVQLLPDSYFRIVTSGFLCRTNDGMGHLMESNKESNYRVSSEKKKSFHENFAFFSRLFRFICAFRSLAKMRKFFPFLRNFAFICFAKKIESFREIQ